MKWGKVLLASVLILVCLTGCWDAVEIEEQYLVWVMGWDVPKENPDQLLLSLSSPTTAEKAPETFSSIAATGYSVEEARNNIQRYLFREIEFGHLRVLLIGKEFAEKGILKHLDTLGRNPKIGRETLIAVVDGRAQELFELKNPGIAQPGEYMVELLRRNARVDNAVKSSFREFFESTSVEGREPATAYVKMTNNKFGFNSTGIAVFKGDRMVGSLHGIDIQAYLLIRSLAKTGRVTIGRASEPNGQSTTFRYHRYKTKIKTKVIEDKPHVYIDITLEGDIVEFTPRTPINNQDSIRTIEETLEKTLTNQFSKTVKKCQQEFESDIFGFGTYFRALHPRYWNTIQWDQEFPDMKLHMKVEVEIRRIGIES